MDRFKLVSSKEIPDSVKYMAEAGIAASVDGQLYWFEYNIVGRCVDRFDSEYEVDSMKIVAVDMDDNEIPVDDKRFDDVRSQIELNCLDHWMDKEGRNHGQGWDEDAGV